MPAYTYDLGICLRKDKTHAAENMTATHETVKQMTEIVEGHSQIYT
jgi:hypothetical protein